MSLRRLHHEQPDSFEFTPANLDWAKKQIGKFPPNRQASAVVPLLMRAQEQEGWLSKPAIEYVADLLGMASIRALECATFYFMFQLQPVGKTAHVQVCGTTSCMICGAEDLVAVCQEKIALEPHQLSDDGKFSWEEVECLGACSNAPMVQIGKDYYEDLTAEKFSELLDAFARGEVPAPGPQNGRFASEPKGGLTTLKERERQNERNASVDLALEMQDTIARITGEKPRPEMPEGTARPETPPAESTPDLKDRFVEDPSADALAMEPDVGGGESDVPVRGESGGEGAPDEGGRGREGEASEAAEGGAAGERDDEVPFGAEEPSPAARLKPKGVAEDVPGGAAPGGGEPMGGAAPPLLDGPRDGQPHDLQQIRGIGPKIETGLNELGIWHVDQIAGWTDEHIRWIEVRLGFPGRVERDDWIAQAKALNRRD